MSLASKSEVDQKGHNDNAEDEILEQTKVAFTEQVGKAGADDEPENGPQKFTMHDRQQFKRHGKKRPPGSSTNNYQVGNHQSTAPSSHVLSDNHAMLKAININKMNHQYIQNLQKANMTLKCKIKEMREIEGGLTLTKQQTSESEVKAGRKDDDGEWFDLEEADEELELKALGTIEEMSREAQQKRQERNRHKSEAKERREKERNFYDKGRLGRSGSKKVRGGGDSIVDQVRRDQARKNPQQTRQQHAPPAHHDGRRDYYRYDDYPYYGYQNRDYGEGYWEHDGRWYDKGYYGGDYYQDWYGQQENYLDRVQHDRGSHQRGRQQANRRGRSYQNEGGRQHAQYQWMPKQAGPVDDERDLEVERPAVSKVKKQPVNEDKKDLRPAVFINDLKKRSKVLEEEKAQHRERVRAAAASKSNDSPNKLTMVNSTEHHGSVNAKTKGKKQERHQEETEPIVLEVVAKIDKVKRALQQEDHQALKDVIYEHKMKEPVDAEIRSIQASDKTFHKLTSLKSDLDEIIEKAAAKLVEAQSMK